MIELPAKYTKYSGIYCEECLKIVMEIMKNSNWNWMYKKVDLGDA